MENRRDTHYLQPSYTSISFVSGKGGVGKTIMAINTACELSRYANVLIVDFDLYNFGLTLRFGKTLAATHKANPETLTLAELYQSYDPRDTFQSQLVDLTKRLNLASVVMRPETHKIFILPCFVPNTESQANLATAMQSSTSKPQNPEDLARLLCSSIDSIASQYQISFVIFDCHPGVVAYSSPCCSISDCNVLVSDFDKSSLLSSVIFTALVEKDINSRLGDFAKHPVRHWRVVVNRVPSWRQFEECPARLDEAIKLARNPDIEAFFSGLYDAMIKDFTVPLATIPDLEELRDHRLETRHELSSARRGGNGLILATKAMIRNMEQYIGPLSAHIPFCRRGDRMDEAFDALKSIYYTDRGLGRSGITRVMLLLVVIDVVCAVLLSCVPGKVPTVIPEATLILVFAIALYGIVRQNRLSRRCFDIFLTISEFDRRNYSQATRHRLYNEGGSPATTSAIWFPKAVWFLCCFLGLLLAVTNGQLATNGFQHLWTFLTQHRAAAIGAIGVVGSVVGFISWVFGNVTEAIRGVKKDIMFFLFSVLIVLGLIKGKEMTEYY